MTIKNVDRLLQKINNLQNSVTGKEFGQVLNKANKQYVQAEAKLLCPVNHGELRNSIKTEIKTSTTNIVAITYTNTEHAAYVEFGTGPVGQDNHDGISPNINPTYSQHGWGIPADKIDPADAIKYKWPKRTYGGKDYYMTSGQPAQPFMYPALKNNEDKVKKAVSVGMINKVKKEVLK